MSFTNNRLNGSINGWLHKNRGLKLVKSRFLKNSSISAENFEFSKRKFIFSSIGFLGLLSFFPFLAFQNRGSYGLFVSVNSSDLPPGDSKYMKRSAFRALKNKMLSEKKILSFHYYRIPSKKRTAWIYVFDSRKSFLEWRDEVKAHGMFVSQNLPSRLRYTVQTFSLLS